MSDDEKFGSKIAMEIPTQLREFAVKNVDQTEQAFLSFVDAASKTVSVVPSPATAISKTILSITERNMRATFDHARNLFQASDLSEVMKLQSEFFRKQSAAVAEQMKALGTNGTQNEQ